MLGIVSRKPDDKEGCAKNGNLAVSGGGSIFNISKLHDDWHIFYEKIFTPIIIFGYRD